MEEMIEKETNEKTKLLQIKINMLEKDLHEALTRAEIAEMEIDRLKRISSSSACTISFPHNSNNNDSEFDFHSNFNKSKSAESLSVRAPPPPPPPPPPPMPNLTVPTSTMGKLTLKTSSTGSLNKTNINVPQATQQSTGEFLLC